MLIENKFHVTVPVQVIMRKIEELAVNCFGHERSYLIALIRGLETNEERVVNPAGLFFAMHNAADFLARESQRGMRKKIYSILEALRDPETDEFIDETQKVALAFGSLINTKSMKGLYGADAIH